jgi:hypothetical protein
MRIILGCLLVLLLSGCITARQPLSPEVATRVKQGHTAVYFNDDIGEIDYLDDKYLVLGVSTEGSRGTYQDIWDSSPELSQLHAEQFDRLGLKAQSLYHLMSAADIQRDLAADRDIYTLSGKNPNPRQTQLSDELRNALLAQGQATLIWIAWTGLTLHIQALGLPTKEQIVTRFWAFDVKENRLLWSGQFLTFHVVSLEGHTAKEFMEADNLSRFKSEVEDRMREYYEHDKYGNRAVGSLSGLERGTP